MKSKSINLELKIHRADNFWKRFKGLLFYKHPIIEEGLLISPCNSVHMFFMRFPIDVVFLDQSNKVIKTVPNLKPWRVISPVSGAYAALELPIGTISKENIHFGDSIIF